MIPGFQYSTMAGCLLFINLRSPLQFPPLVLLHGLSGNENSLPPLVSKFNQARWILSPRGLESAPDNGYAWAHEKSRNMSDFKTSLNAFFLN